jgi:hypothetical protein
MTDIPRKWSWLFDYAEYGLGIVYKCRACLDGWEARFSPMADPQLMDDELGSHMKTHDIEPDLEWLSERVYGDPSLWRDLLR